MNPNPQSQYLIHEMKKPESLYQFLWECLEKKFMEWKENEPKIDNIGMQTRLMLEEKFAHFRQIQLEDSNWKNDAKVIKGLTEPLVIRLSLSDALANGDVYFALQLAIDELKHPNNLLDRFFWQQIAFAWSLALMNEWKTYAREQLERYLNGYSTDLYPKADWSKGFGTLCAYILTLAYKNQIVLGPHTNDKVKYVYERYTLKGEPVNKESLRKYFSAQITEVKGESEEYLKARYPKVFGKVSPFEIALNGEKHIEI